MPSGNAHMYRQLNGRRLLTGMVLAILTLGLIVIDLGMGSSGIGPGGHYHVHCRRSVFVRFAHEKREVTC